MKLRVFAFLLCFAFLLSGAVFAADDSTTVITLPAVEGYYPADSVEVLPDFREYDAILPAFIYELFGQYQPLTQSVSHFLPDGTKTLTTEYVDGLAGVDWTYIASVALFALVLYCVFRIIGGIFKCK